MGTVVTGIVVALTSTLSPADAGPDTPAVAVMSVLAGSIAAALAAKGASTQAIILNVMVGISVSTLFTGILLFGLGALKLGQWVRFIPYPVIAGFLAASGWLLITGGVEVVTQSNLTLSPASWAMLYSPTYGPQILVGLAFAVAIVLIGRCGAGLPGAAGRLHQLPRGRRMSSCSASCPTRRRAMRGSCRASDSLRCGGRSRR